VTITFSEAISGLTESDLVIGYGTLSNWDTVTASTYTAIVNPTTSGEAVTVTVAANSVLDGTGNANPASNTLSLMYDTTKPVVVFGGFTDGQLFTAPPANVTLTVNEAVYWISDGAELDSVNALPLISMEKDGAPFADYTASFDENSLTLTLTFDDRLEDGRYEVLVAGNAVRNMNRNTLDAASSAFTVAVPVITGISATETNLPSAGGDTIVSVTGANLNGQTIEIYADGIMSAPAVVIGGGAAEATVSLPRNLTYANQSHTLTVFLNGVEVAGRSAAVTVSGMPVPIIYSGQAELAALDISASGKSLELLPLFAPEITTYTAETDAEEIELHAAAAHPKANVALLGEGTDGSTNVALAMGANVLTIRVQAEDGTVRTYTLTIHRVAKDGDAGPGSPACSFADIANHWAKPAICEAADLGIAEGASSKLFVPPDGFVTRTEFAVMLQRTLRIAISSEDKKMPYSDAGSIPEWARPAILTAVTEGILEGYPDNTLRPARRVTRAEMAAMLSRAMTWDTGLTQGPDFADHDNIPLWAKGYIEAARMHGIITGREGNQFVPDGLTTRAEAAVAMLRLWKLLYE
jgi:hypothetical protein